MIRLMDMTMQFPGNDWKQRLDVKAPSVEGRIWPPIQKSCVPRGSFKPDPPDCPLWQHPMKGDDRWRRCSPGDLLLSESLNLLLLARQLERLDIQGVAEIPDPAMDGRTL